MGIRASLGRGDVGAWIMGFGWVRRVARFLIPDASRAVQGQRQVSPPYPEAEATSDELASL
jgi:hypothetical protein